MSAPYGGGAAPAPAKPVPNPAFSECGNCGHFPNWHALGIHRPLPWLAASHCHAYDVDSPNQRCRCPGWRAKR